MPTSQPPSAAGTPDPWSYPSETVDPAAPSHDLLISPAEAALDGRARRRRLPVLIAVATVVAVVLGGAAYAGMRLWYGSGAQPEKATPSTVIAFARLDLSPGYGQRRNINNLVKKFPRESGKDIVDGLKQGIFDELGVDEASYRTHVEPWFADRVGVALWLDGKKRPYSLIVLAADDESAAGTGLTELQRKRGADEFGFVVRSGYALVAKGHEDSQPAADTAGKDAERESLAALPQFRQGVDWLPAQQTALAWGDLAKLGAAMNARMEAAFAGMPEAPGEDPMRGVDPLGGGLLLVPGIGGFPGMGGPAQWGNLKGHVIVGAQATDNGVEVRFRGFGTGAGAQGAPADARSTVDALPANSVVAGSFRVGDLGAQLAGRSPNMDEMLPEEMLKGLPPGEADRMRKEAREATERFAAINEAFSALSGAKISIAATRLGGDDIPALIAAAEMVSGDKAAALVRALKLLGGDVKVTARGNKVELTTKRYAAEGGTLGGEALYREALEGAPQEATAILYLDLERLLVDETMTERERRQAKPVKAIGLATGTEGGDLVGLLRVVIK